MLQTKTGSEILKVTQTVQLLFAFLFVMQIGRQFTNTFQDVFFFCISRHRNRCQFAIHPFGLLRPAGGARTASPSCHLFYYFTPITKRVKKLTCMFLPKEIKKYVYSTAFTK